jgi:hypothetical protein
MMIDDKPGPIKKWCSGCKEVKPIEDFDALKNRRNSADGLRRHCKVCQEKIDYTPIKKLFEGKKRHYENHPEILMYKGAKRRAKEQGLPFDLKIEDIVIPERCPVFGTPLFRNTGSCTGSAGPNSPSLDKIIPALGYVKGNITVISYKANIMKNNATLEQCVLLGEYASRLIVARDFLAKEQSESN